MEGHYCYKMKDEIGEIHAVQSAKLIIKAKSTVLNTPVRCDDLHRLLVLEKNGYSKADLLSLTDEDIHRIVDDEIDPDTAHAITTDNVHLLYHTFRNVYSLPIHWISCLGNNSMAQMVLKHYLPNEFKGGEDPLHTAICFGHLDITKFLLEKYPDSIDFTTHDGSTCWHTAAWAGHVQIMRLLCQIKPQGASITRKNGEIPLHVAMRRQNYHVTQALLDAYPQGSAVTSPLSGYKPLADASRTNKISFICSLLYKLEFEGIFEPNRFNYPSYDLSIPKEAWNRRDTPWSVILDKCGKEGTIKIFMESHQYSIGLHGAIGFVPIDEIKFILESIPNIDLRLRDNDDRNVLLMTIHKACDEGNRQYWHVYYQQVIELIIVNYQKQYGRDSVANMMVQNGTGRHFLHIAAELGLPWEGLQTIMTADINASYLSDSKTSLLPFMLVAADERSRLRRAIQRNNNVVTSDLTTVYKMVQFGPDVLKNINQSSRDDPPKDQKQMALFLVSFLCSLYYYLSLRRWFSQSDENLLIVSTLIPDL